MGELLLRDILVIFLAAIPVIFVLRLFRLPPLIGFILTGVLIGPSAIGIVRDAGRIELLAEMGVTLLLFVVGLEFSFSAFSRLKGYIVKGGTLQIVTTAAAGFLIGSLFGWSPSKAFTFGCLIALSSTAVVLSSLFECRTHESIHGRIATGILILQDLAVIPMMVALTAMSGSSGAAAITGLAGQVGLSLLVLALTYIFIRFLSDPLFGWISRAHSRELFLIAIICMALGMAWLTHEAGLSFALGAFLGGLMVGGEYKVQALGEIGPFRYAFSSLFFVSIGMILDLPFLLRHLPAVLLLVVLIPVLKAALIAGILLLLKAPPKIALGVGIVLGQIGEFSFLLAGVGRQAGVLDATIYQYVMATAAMTMLITPLVVRMAVPMAEQVGRWPGFRRLKGGTSEAVLTEEAAVLSGHVVICGFGPLGEALGRLLDEHHIPYLVLELNPETIQRLRSRNKRVFFGDGSSEEILYKSGIERARLLAITVPDYLNNIGTVRQARLLNAEVKIITRAKYRNEVNDLYAAGADVVVSEELEGGIEMGRHALQVLGLPRAEVDTYIQKIRSFGSADFF